MAAFSFSAPRFTDEMMEAEKNAMTEEHRNRIEAEVYGLETSDRGAKEETSEMMAESLESFQSHLDSIQHKPTYLQAVDKCPELFETESAPIRFLRAESYDTEKAAQRLVNYWEFRKDLFGPEKAFLPLRLEGGALDDSSLQYLQQSPEIFWPIGPDEHGRCILFTDKGRFDTSKKYDRKALGRFLWYVMHVALEDEEFQHNGFIELMLMRITHMDQMDRRLQIQTFDSFNKALPVKFRSVHLCHPPVFFGTIWPVLRHCMGTELRQRTFIRKGSDQQVMAELEACGIPREQVPRSMGGEYIMKINRWIAKRKAIEAERFDGIKMDLALFDETYAEVTNREELPEEFPEELLEEEEEEPALVVPEAKKEETTKEKQMEEASPAHRGEKVISKKSAVAPLLDKPVFDVGTNNKAKEALSEKKKVVAKKRLEPVAEKMVAAGGGKPPRDNDTYERKEAAPMWLVERNEVDKKPENNGLPRTKSESQISDSSNGRRRKHRVRVSLW